MPPSLNRGAAARALSPAAIDLARRTRSACRRSSATAAALRRRRDGCAASPPLCAAANGAPRGATFALALGALAGAALERAHARRAPLRRWRLIEVEPGRALAAQRRCASTSASCITSTGVDQLDARLRRLLRPRRAGDARWPSQHALAAAIASRLARGRRRCAPLVQLDRRRRAEARGSRPRPRDARAAAVRRCAPRTCRRRRPSSRRSPRCGSARRRCSAARLLVRCGDAGRSRAQPCGARRARARSRW